ncbi:MAG TPA: MarC family protein [bacterium]|jgi:multiple antibiotic resistance protein
MLLYFIQAFAAAFASTDPIGAAPVFVGLTAQMDKRQKIRAAIRASVSSFLILAIAVVLGRYILGLFGISLPAFQAAGGLVIVLMGLEMLRGTPTRVQHDDQTDEETDDPIIVPFSMPLVAGPGAITTMITLTARSDSWANQFIVLVAIGIETCVLLAILLSAAWLSSHISQSGLKVLLRFLGLILLAIGAQLLLSGVQQFMLPGKS